jgi:L-alanine-DL-glutamate epimerase-like enolase superfamily enzyme
MRIELIEAIPYRILYRKPLRFASGMVTEADHVLVRLTTSDGVVGIADTPPRPYTYGETQSSIVAVVEELFGPALLGLRVTELERIHEVLNRTIGNNAAKGAIDIAVWDALGRTLGVPVTELLGGYTTGMRVSHMLGFDEPVAVLDEALAMRETYGIDAFKIKVGRLPVEDDLAVCAALREGLGPRTELYVDANRGWSANQAIAALPALVDAGVSMLEEPDDAKEAMGRRRLVQQSPIPIVGDESVPTPGDVSRELLSGGCTAISIKTARGGFTNATRVLDLCDGLGVDVIMGNQIDTQIGTAATVAFGAARRSPSRRPGELSNYLDMDDDLIAEPLVIADGFLAMPTGNGVGVDIDAAKLEHYRQDR